MAQQVTPIQRRAIRFGALGALLLAGLAFHHTGTGYTAVRTIYVVVILGLLLTRFGARRGA
jgi:hypothetical protein